jgi:hypothetical protein
VCMLSSSETVNQPHYYVAALPPHPSNGAIVSAGLVHVLGLHRPLGWRPGPAAAAAAIPSPPPPLVLLLQLRRPGAAAILAVAIGVAARGPAAQRTAWEHSEVEMHPK